jgi:hypothetical protein
MAKRTVITLVLPAVPLAAFAEEKQSLPRIDGRIITGNAPKAPEAFAFAIVRALAESKRPKGSNHENPEHHQERSD